MTETAPDPDPEGSSLGIIVVEVATWSHMADPDSGPDPDSDPEGGSLGFIVVKVTAWSHRARSNLRIS